MNIVAIFPKEIHVTFELSSGELNSLIECLDKARIEYDGKQNPEMAHYVETLDSFYKLLTEAQDGLPERPAA